MKRITIILSAISCLLAVSCDKEKKAEEATPAELAVVVENAKDIYESPKNLSVSLNLAVAADPVSEEAYTITLGPKPGLVASYNTAHGTSYESLPSSAYTLSSSTLMLTKYSPKSTAAELRLKGDGCEQDKTYVLPIGIESVQGGTNFHAPDDKAAFIIFKVTAPEQQGSGKSGDPYIIEDLEGFLKIGSMMQDDATTYFKLATDIDFAEVKFTEESPWTPFNYATTDEEVAAAEKRMIDLDGDNHKISNFTGGGALFGVLVGSVQNLTIENADITCSVNNAGATLAGSAGTTASADALVIKNVKVVGSKLTNDYKRSGGLVAWIKGGTVENVDVECTITGIQQNGGLVGRVESGTFINCSASGNITSESYYSGGLVGVAVNIDIKNCHASGNVTGTSGSYTRAGGLIGQIDGSATIENCYATGNVEGTGHMAGGLVGVIAGDDAVINISKSYATGSVTLPHGESGNWAHAGGLIGTLNALNASVTISNCYATGAVLVRRYSSGFVGSIYAKAAKELKITNSYSASDLSGIVVADRCGIVLGLNDGASGTPPTTITCTGFVAWNISDRLFSYAGSVAEDGNYYGKEGTVSQQAAKLNWDTSIWDLSAELPKLK
ncbi:MAG: DUF1735 domain-containing protein [Bacteroidales bacterium]|nr:DUF1735 domain-containing protein [Bacteroidales bacterium]